MRLFHLFSGMVLAITVLAIYSGSASATIIGSTADLELAGNNDQIKAGTTTIDSGRNNTDGFGPDLRTAVFVFDVSSFTSSVSNVELAITLDSVVGTPTDGRLMAVGDSGSSGTLPTGFAGGGFDTVFPTGAVELESSFVTATTLAGTTLTYSGADLDTFLNDRSNDFVFFAIDAFTAGDNGAAYPSAGDGHRFSFVSADASSDQPTLIPEPASLALMGLGGLLMIGRGRQAKR